MPSKSLSQITNSLNIFNSMKIMESKKKEVWNIPRKKFHSTWKAVKATNNGSLNIANTDYKKEM